MTETAHIPPMIKLCCLQHNKLSSKECTNRGYIVIVDFVWSVKITDTYFFVSYNSPWIAVVCSDQKVAIIVAAYTQAVTTKKGT